MKKLSIIIPVHNQFEILFDCLMEIGKNSITNPEIILIDNGSSRSLLTASGISNQHIILRNDQNVGVWPTFRQGFDWATGDVLCYIHSDLMIHEYGWDKRVLDAFEADPKLGLTGFIGSNQWSYDGGRGGGTMSNFAGQGRGSAAEVHGRRVSDLVPALQVDGCSMIMSREAMVNVGFFDWPPHHFYDRVYSLKMLKAGWHVAVHGVLCDHISGQTANCEPGWHNTAQEWCEAHSVPFNGNNWDHTVYQEAERRFLPELHEFLAGRRQITCDSQHNIQ